MRVFRILPLILVLAMTTLAACVPVQPTVTPAAPPAATATSATSSEQPGATPAPSVVATAASSPAPANGTPAVVLLAITPVEPPERVEFAAGSTSAQLSGLLPTGMGVKQYVLAARAGQTLNIVVTSDGVPLSVIVEGPDGARWASQAALAGGGYRAAQTVALPVAGDYRVTLAKAEHTPSTNYRVAFALDTK